MASKTIDIGTDIAAFALFHPDDLTHRKDDPIAWYSYAFAYRRESAAGRLIVFGTMSDGGYRIRLTTGELTDLERDWRASSFDFPLIVRHGRVLIDNTDALPGEEQQTDPSEMPDRWFELPSGAYKVTISAMALPEDGNEPPENHPDFVVRFVPVADIATIPAAATPPQLPWRRGTKVEIFASSGDEAPTPWLDHPPEVSALVVLLDGGRGGSLLPYESSSRAAPDAIIHRAFPPDGSWNEERAQILGSDLRAAFLEPRLRDDLTITGLRFGDETAVLEGTREIGRSDSTAERFVIRCREVAVTVRTDWGATLRRMFSGL